MRKKRNHGGLLTQEAKISLAIGGTFALYTLAVVMFVAKVLA